MNFPKHIFKAYDIRGLYPEELTEELAYKIGRAYGQIRQKELGCDDTVVVVGRDMRLSSPDLAKAVIEGLIDQGVDVIDIGLASTPTFYFAVSFYGYDGGLQISASHNPKEYNGVKIVRASASPFGKGTGMEELSDLVQNGDFSEKKTKEQVVKKDGVVDAQVDLELKFAGTKEIGKFKIVVDTANSMGAPYLEKLFDKLPQIELVKMNWELDGTFPSHLADPFVEENVADLKKKVIEEKADLGIATDGDGDRIFFIDNEGKMVDPAIVRGIMAKIFLQIYPKATICYDIRPGKITRDMILENGGTPVVTRVGHSFIKQKMVETSAVFGGESSGHFFAKFDHGIYEAPMVVTLKLLQELTKEKQSLVEYIKPFKKYFHSGEHNFKVEDKEGMLQTLKERYSNAEINDLDGLSFTYPDYWFNVRASNTESLLRLNLEAKTEELMVSKLEEVKNVIIK